MKTLLAAAALIVAGVTTAQAADIAPVTAHWTKLGKDFSALVYYIDEPDGHEFSREVWFVSFASRHNW